MKWNQQLLSMRCCIIEGKKFSILPNKEKGKVGVCRALHPTADSDGLMRKSSILASGHFYSAECYFFLCRYAVPVEDRIEEKGVCVCV